MKKTKTRIPKPVMKPQPGEFQQIQTIRFDLPLQFVMLCKLMHVSPQQLLEDFIDNISNGSWKREGREKARQHLVDYFIAHDYGRNYYTADELHSMFSELDAMASLFPKDGEPEHLEAYSAWRASYQQYWFKKWLHQ